VPRAGFQPCGEFSISRARRRQCAGSYLAILATDRHSQKRHISLITYAKMLNFGERGYCNILLNFGIQCVTRFEQIG
jgi:hypothetical protein